MIGLTDILLLHVARWVLLLVEVLLARRIYRAVRNQSLLRRRLAKLSSIATAILRPSNVSGSPEPQPPTRGLQLEAASILLLGELLPSPPRILWRRLAEAVQVVAVFVVVFLGASYLMRPSTGQWALFLLPPILPLVFLPLPYLLSLEPSPSALLMGAGVALGILSILILGV